MQLRSGQEPTLPGEALAPPNQSAVSTALLEVRRSRVRRPTRVQDLPVVPAMVTARGWLALRYTGECIFRHLAEVVEQILAVVRQRRNPRRNELLALETTPVWRWHKSLWVNHEPQLPEPTIPPAGPGDGH